MQLLDASDGEWAAESRIYLVPRSGQPQMRRGEGCVVVIFAASRVAEGRSEPQAGNRGDVVAFGDGWQGAKRQVPSTVGTVHAMKQEFLPCHGGK